MKQQNQPIFRIAIVEDNAFYNKLIRHELEAYLNKCHVDSDRTYRVDCFTSYQEFYSNFNRFTDLAFIDYQLDHQATGLWVVKEIRDRSDHCRIYMMSDEQQILNLYSCIIEGANGIVIKNKETPFWCKYIVETQLQTHA